MELKTKDTYRIYSSRELSASDMDVLMTLYQPLIGGDAVLVYLTLFAESRNTHVGMKHARLMNLMNSIQIDTFQHARMKLEEYMLLRTYMKETEKCNTYIYLLQSPLTASDFLSSSLYANRYIRVAQKRTYDETMSKYGSLALNTEGYNEITVQVKNLKEDDYDNTVTYTTVKPRYQFHEDDITIDFDYEHFIATTSTSVFPAELRTQENMSYIGKFATLYGLSADKMRVLVMRCVSLETMVLDIDRLKFMCEKSKPDIKNKKDIYENSPVSFLQSKQNGAEVSMNDKRILERLSFEMHFPPVVINIMIEYILKISDNRLNSKFVDMVAGEWARDGITTKEQAIQETKKNISYRRSYNHVDNKSVVPDYMKRQKEGNINSSPATKEALLKAQELQKKLGGNS